MGLFNFDKNKILGAVFQTASNVLNTASRALGSAAKTAKKVSTASSNIGKTPIVQPTASAKPAAPAPVAPVQVTEGEPDLGKPIAPGSSKPMAPVAPEPLTADAGTIAKLMAEIEKLKKERDFLLQAQQAKDSKPFGAAGVSSNAASFEQQLEVAAAIDAERASNPEGDEKELRQRAIDKLYYPEDEGQGMPDDADELAGLEPGPIPF